ncbi:MAG TPA: carbohydrate kinase [Nitrospiraceae bacterium]|nr:carbohydrate kinase [Nitrospiraceae bacterium]
MNVVGLGQCSLDNLFFIDAFPTPDTKKEAIDLITAGGGPVATALVSLSRLGIDCSFHGITGDDEAGSIIADSLNAEHVDIKGLLVRPQSCSQVACIVIEKGTGRRTIFWKRPSGDPLKPEELPGNFLENTDFLLIDGLMTEASFHAVRRARERNIPIMLDAGRVREGMIELARLCDYVVASEEFGRELSGDGRSFDAEAAVRHMNSFGARASTITLGDRGSITITENKIFRTPAFKVNVADTTGAGDVFHGGYIFGLLKRWDMKDVVRFASAFAALKCTQPGGRAGIPTLRETENFLSAQV